MEISTGQDPEPAAPPPSAFESEQPRTGRWKLRAGDRVRVRQQWWTVASVEPHDQCALVTLSGSDAAGHVRQVLVPFDDVEPETRGDKVRIVGRRTWAHAARALIAANGPAATLQIAPHAGVTLLPYQLEPALALLNGYGSRVLIADEVGLGKTIQAALAAAELRARGAAGRILIVTPAGLRDQWIEELRTRFALPFVAFDQPMLRCTRASLASDVNPWIVEPLVVASVDYVKRPEVLPLVLSATWDLVIVDEAHGASGASDRHAAVVALCRQAAYVILLTATPHNGDDAAFSSLCGIGALDDALLVFRRSRQETGCDAGRRVHILHVRPSGDERRMLGALDDLAVAMRAEGAAADHGRWLLLSLLYKRALSSPYALAESVARRLRVLADDSPTAEQLPLPLDDYGEHDASDMPPAWTAPALADGALERRLLTGIVTAARLAERHDSKRHRLRRLLRALREPAIVFTEYRDTLVHLHRHAAPHAALIHGGLSRDERRSALADFERQGLLFATDAAGEGLNLQHGCRTVVNIELPWNPMRLEQRIGRVDRIGQTKRTHVFHLIARGSGEEQLVARLNARVSRANDRVGAASPFVDRSAWTDQFRTHLATGLDDGPAESSGLLAALPRTRLVAEAADAWRRATIVRACSTPRRDSAGDNDGRPAVPVVAGSRPLLARSAHPRTRAALNGAALALFRTVMTDGAGRSVASHITPVLVRNWSDDEEFLRAVAALDVSSHRAWHEWYAASAVVQRRRAAMATHRAEVLSRMLAASRGPMQAGLFDRRAERQRKSGEDTTAAALATVTTRLRRAEMSAELHVSSAELALLLFPANSRSGR